jgi:hypothetical protein
MAVICGLIVAIPFSLLGAGFGAWARLVGKWFDKVPEATMSRAAMKGLWSGGLFLAVLGFAGGGVLGWFGLPSETIIRIVTAAFLLLLLLMVGASIAGSVAFGLEWLGSLRSAYVIALGVNGLFLAVPIRNGVLRSLSADGSEVSLLGHLLVWSLAVLAGFAILALLMGLVWFTRLVLGGAWYLLAASKRNRPAIEKPA